MERLQEHALDATPSPFIRAEAAPENYIGDVMVHHTRVIRNGVDVTDSYVAAKLVAPPPYKPLAKVTKRAPQRAPFAHVHPHTGRNQPCGCGSGKKFKHCCKK